MNLKISGYIKVVLFFGLGIGMMLLVYHYQNLAFKADCALKGIPDQACSLLDKLKDDLSRVRYGWIWITIIAFMLSNVLRAHRWKMMLEAIGYKPKMTNLLGTVMVNYLANLGIPRSGEVIRAAMLSKYENIPFEKSFGTVVTDRIFDAIMMAIIFIVTFFLGGRAVADYLNQNIHLEDKLRFLTGYPFVLLSVFLLGFLTVWGVYKNRAKIRNTAFGNKIMLKLKGFYDGILSVRKVSNIPLFIFHSVVIWVLYFLMQYLAFFSFDPTQHLDIIAGLVVFSFGSLGIVIPTPGGMGSFHFLTAEALAIYGIQGSDAFTYANIVFFSIQIFANIFFGVIALIILPVFNKSRS
ncbi:MAG: flippase-like domain-containing protein [Chitinophagales bacterium]|nr:flippase-like domain-containing protein [Chitinophagales bacterium]